MLNVSLEKVIEEMSGYFFFSSFPPFLYTYIYLSLSSIIIFESTYNTIESRVIITRFRETAG